MELESYRKIIVAIGLIGLLLFASPTIAIFVKSPSGQPFSELYLLGPNHTFENIPFNIVSNIENLIYLGAGNERGQSSYYTIYVKIASQNESLPNLDLSLPSSLPSIYEYKLFLESEATWQAPLLFQANNLTFQSKTSFLPILSINGIDYSVNKSSSWDSSKQGYFYNLIFELWFYNETLGIQQYDNRFVLLRLNMTTS